MGSFQLGVGALEVLQSRAVDLGFDKFIYAVESLYGEMSRPLAVIGIGWPGDYLDKWLDRLSQDPIRRMVARGEIRLTSLPIAFENTGAALSLVSGRRMSAGEISLMRWSRERGVHLGVSMAIRMPRGRYASINFYAEELVGCDLDLARERLFLIGHEAHAALDGTLASQLGDDVKRLSTREVETLEWIARGKTNKEIAELLGLGVDTVKEHAHVLFDKLEVNGRAQAVARGHALGYLG